MTLPQVHMMSSVSYDEEFPLLQLATTNDGMETQQPKVYNLKAVELDGTTKKVSPTEAVLNW